MLDVFPLVDCDELVGVFEPGEIFQPDEVDGDRAAE